MKIDYGPHEAKARQPELTAATDPCTPVTGGYRIVDVRSP